MTFIPSRRVANAVVSVVNVETCALTSSTCVANVVFCSTTPSRRVASAVFPDVFIIINQLMEPAKGKVTVVNVKAAELRKQGYKDFAAWAQDPSHVYIGRDMTRYVFGAHGSPLANPFHAKKYGRDECIQLFSKHLNQSPKLIEIIKDLKKKNITQLGCWCAPESCHGDVIAKMMNECNE